MVKKIRSQAVTRLKERHTGVSLQALCGLFGYTRQAYYKHLRIHAKHCLEKEVVLKRIHSYRKWMPRIGGTKLHYLMNQGRYRISRKTLFSILRTNSLLVRKRKKYALTTNSRHPDEEVSQFN